MIMKKDDVAQELLQFKEKIDEAKAAKARIEGELKSLRKRLLDDFGSDDPTEVEKKVSSMRQQAIRLRKQVEEGLVVLRKEMGDGN